MICQLALYLIVARSQNASAGLSSVASKEICDAVSWLPPDTETLTVAASPGQTRSLAKSREKLANDIFDLAYIGLASDGSGNVWPLRYRFIVDGTRNYRFPKDLGLCPYDGCSILSLDANEETKAEERAKKLAHHTATLNGHHVFVFQNKVTNPKEEDQWKWYVTFDGSYMFCATDKTLFIQVLDRKSKPQNNRALPDSLEQWKYVEPGARFFAVRNFSVFSRHMAADVNMDDPQIVGNTVCLSNDDRKVSIVAISENPKGFDIARELWGSLKTEGWKYDVTTSRIDDRTTRTELDAQGDRSGIPIFVLLIAVGHPVFV